MYEIKFVSQNFYYSGYSIKRDKKIKKIVE